MTARGPRVTPYVRWLLRAGPADYMLALSVAGASLPVVGKRLEPLARFDRDGHLGRPARPDGPIRDGEGLAARRASPTSVAGNGRTPSERLRRRAARGLVVRGSGRRMARAGADAADLGCVASAPLPLPPWSPLRRQPGAGARRVAPQGSARATRAGADLRAGRRLGARQPDAAGVRADVTAGRAGLGVSGHRLPGRAAPPLAAPHHRRQDRHRLGASQRRQVRRRPQFRCGGGLFGGRTPVRAGRADRQRPRRTRPSCPRAPTARWTRWSGSTAATTGRTGPPPSGTGSSTSWSGWWSDGRSPVTPRCSATRRRSRACIKNAPPFLVIHGSSDSVIPVEQARSFVERLRAVSHSMVGYVELPGAGHGFDLIDGERAGVMATRDCTVPQPGLSRQGTDRRERGDLSLRR